MTSEEHLNTLGTNAINNPVAPVSLEDERRRFREPSDGAENAGAARAVEPARLRAAGADAIARRRPSPSASGDAG